MRWIHLFKNLLFTTKKYAKEFINDSNITSTYFFMSYLSRQTKKTQYNEIHSIVSQILTIWQIYEESKECIQCELLDDKINDNLIKEGYGNNEAKYVNIFITKLEPKYSDMSKNMLIGLYSGIERLSVKEVAVKLTINMIEEIELFDREWNNETERDKFIILNSYIKLVEDRIVCKEHRMRPLEFPQYYEFYSELIKNIDEIEL